MNKHIQKPHDYVLKAFNLNGALEWLPGGQGTTWRIGTGIVKPIEEPKEALYVADIMNEIIPTDFRVARPIKANTNSWIYEGWVAYQYIEGEHKKELLDEKIATCRAFHEALANFPKPHLLEERKHLYAIADRMAWQEQPLKASEKAKPLVEDLQKLIHPIKVKTQLIHGDITGNILFADNLKPAVIDLSPYWRPADYALAVLLVDAIVWEHAEHTILEHMLLVIPDFDQLLLRALIGRIMQLDLLMKEASVDKMSEVKAHMPLAEKISRIILLA
jgi:uncharacterized protein (TIGR02569 family)